MADYTSSATLQGSSAAQWVIQLDVNVSSQSDTRTNYNCIAYIKSYYMAVSSGYLHWQITAWDGSEIASGTNGSYISANSTWYTLGSGNTGATRYESGDRTGLGITLKVWSTLSSHPSLYKSGNSTTTYVTAPKAPASVEVPSPVSDLKVTQVDSNGSGKYLVHVTWTNNSSGKGAYTGIVGEYRINSGTDAGETNNTDTIAADATAINFTVPGNADVSFGITPSNSAGSASTRWIRYIVEPTPASWSGTKPVRVIRFGGGDAYEISSGVTNPGFVSYVNYTFGSTTYSNKATSMADATTSSDAPATLATDALAMYDKSSTIAVKAEVHYNKYTGTDEKTTEDTILNTLVTDGSDVDAISVPIIYVNVPEGSTMKNIYFNKPDTT